ncbi:hypothetical protein I3271_03385 [Photobacterium leiognathi]|uniref:hypothetical protein n=1 Tax=Photobacterium leiognathi TaxID=553611 RepID=UPI001EE0C42C|nr:hypothetical protein [Photobacterium leiognathi]MCG3883724.1 hypothetical protein [Photobacterium leiognathi]
MMLENSTVGLYLTELAESKLQSVMPFIERSAYILFHDIGRLSLDPHGFAIYQHNGTFVVKLDPALYMSKVESVLGLKAKSEFYAFGPRGGRVSYWPSLSLRDARKWSSSYAPYSKSFYVNSKQLAFIDPLESERDYPVVGSDGLTMKVDSALVNA